MERVTPLYKVVLLGDEYMLTAPEFYHLQGECQEIAQFGNPASVRIDKEGITFKSFSGDVMTQIKSGAKLEDPTGCTHCQHQDQDTSEFDHVADEVVLSPFESYVYKQMQPPEDAVQEPEIIRSPSKELSDLHSGLRDSREFLLTKSPHKAIQEEAQQGMALQTEIDQTISKLPDPDKMLELQEEITTIDPVKTAMDVEILKQKVEQMDKPKTKPGKKPKDYSKYITMLEEGATRSTVMAKMISDGISSSNRVVYDFREKVKKQAQDIPTDPEPKPVVRVIRPEGATDDEIVDVMAMARNKYRLDWTKAGREIWCLEDGMARVQVVEKFKSEIPENVWGFYKATHEEA